MNHRWGARLALSLPAVLHVSGGEKLPCHIDDLGCGGAFVSLPRGRELPGGVVILETWLPYAQPQHCRWRALVIHCREHGVGLMFDDLQFEDLLPFMAAVRKSTERLEFRSLELDQRDDATVLPLASHGLESDVP